MPFWPSSRSDSIGAGRWERDYEQRAWVPAEAGMAHDMPFLGDSPFPGLDPVWVTLRMTVSSLRPAR